MTNKLIPLPPKKTYDFVEKARKLKIAGTSSMLTATEYLSEANNLLDKVIEYKESKTKPLNQALKVIRAETKPFEDALNETIKIIRNRMSIFQTQRLKEQQEAENKILEQVQADKIEAEDAVTQLSNIPEANNQFTSDKGTIRFRQVQCFEVTDKTQLPMDCLVPDLKRIQTLMDESVELPGVRYFTEQRPINYRR